MLPLKEKNIYPKTKKNLKALLSFYFDAYDLNHDGAIESLMKKTSLSLNQIEFVARKLSEAYEVIFRKQLKGQITLTNLFRYGLDATTNAGRESYGSASATLITNEFIQFVKDTELPI